MITINQINGIPLHYARTPQHPYGSIGQQRNFTIEDNFHKELEDCLKLFNNQPDWLLKELKKGNKLNLNKTNS